MSPTQRKILAFDGGPSPVVSLRVLKKLEARFPGFLERVDLLAGTSHGGIISLKLATLLTNGVPAARAIDECIDFDNEFLRSFRMSPVNLLRLLSGILPVASSERMSGFLEKHFMAPDGGLLRIRDLKKQVTISAFDLNIGALRTVHSFEANKPNEPNVTLLSAALACSSFPVLVPFFKPDTKGAKPIVDGGFGANSGAMPALSDALQNMSFVNRGAHVGDFLPYITLLSTGCLSIDEPLRVPLFEPLVQLTEKLGLFGQETKVTGGGTLRSAGWWFLVRNNVRVALTLLENTQVLDRQYAGNLLDHQRYYRMAPRLGMLNFLWLLLTNPDAAFREADALVEEYWSAQMKQYDLWKAGSRPQSNPQLMGYEDLASWVDWYWMRELDPAATDFHPRISLSWDRSEVVLRSTTLDPGKQLATFEASAQPELPQKELAELGTCQFVQDARNVLIVGPSGAGKSHLAQALGNEAVSRGHKVLYMPVARMLEQLAAARAAGTYGQRLAELASVDLLILEDLGLKPMTDSGPGDFYDLVSERAGKKALIVTSSIPPAEWAGRFGDPKLADAILTRLRTGRHELALTGERPPKEGKPRKTAAQDKH